MLTFKLYCKIVATTPPGQRAFAAMEPAGDV